MCATCVGTLVVAINMMIRMYGREKPTMLKSLVHISYLQGMIAT